LLHWAELVQQVPAVLLQQTAFWHFRPAPQGQGPPTPAGKTHWWEEESQL